MYKDFQEPFLWFLGITASCIILPILIYLIIKLGTLGYLNARKHFSDKEKEDNNE